MEFKIDYLTSGTAPSGYTTLGVTGGEGGMLLGNATDLSGFKTSISENLNSNGSAYTGLITNSPATNSTYAPNATYPNWIYDVWYEVTVNKSAFGASGFGYPFIASVHASPSKTGNNTECVKVCGTLVSNNSVNLTSDRVAVVNPSVKVVAMPNPYQDKIVFTITSTESGNSSVDIFDLAGRKVTTLYQGYFEKGTVKTITYNVPVASRNTLIYRFRNGRELTTGKVISIN
jgi:hypothetical protein